MKLISKEVNLHAFSIDGFDLPTFQKAILKTVYCIFKRKVKYVLFYYYSEEMLLKRTYIRVR